MIKWLEYNWQQPACPIRHLKNKEKWKIKAKKDRNLE